VEETTLEELNDLFGLVRSAMSKIESEIGKKPDGFNIGINDGEYAGQTIGHLHVHVIPRFKGDVEDPRGGVRWVLPSKAKYW
jgi:diadenosine tetraphosphate (Ap4A) HIT family hydrolase